MVVWVLNVSKYIDTQRKTKSFDQNTFQTCGKQIFDFDKKNIVIDYKTCQLPKRSIFTTTHFRHVETNILMTTHVHSRLAEAMLKLTFYIT
jgi:hypothetical protein